MVNGFREMDARFPAHVFARDDQANLSPLAHLPFFKLSWSVSMTPPEFGARQLLRQLSSSPAQNRWILAYSFASNLL